MDVNVNPTYPLFSVFAFFSFFLVLIPLPLHIQAWNVGTCAYIVWVSVACLLEFINSVIWRNNTLNLAPVWCDICMSSHSSIQRFYTPRQLQRFFWVLAWAFLQLGFASADGYTLFLLSRRLSRPVRMYVRALACLEADNNRSRRNVEPPSLTHVSLSGSQSSSWRCVSSSIAPRSLIF